MSKRTSECSGCIGLMTETSSPIFRVTTHGDSWIISALGPVVGCPMNSGRFCMSIFKPKNPTETASQVSKPAAIVLGEGRHGVGVGKGRDEEAGGSPVDSSFVVMQLLDCGPPAQRLGPSIV